MNIADILTEYGAYYKGANSQNNMSRLWDLMYLKCQTKMLFAEEFVASTREEAAIIAVGQVIQAFKQEWSPIEVGEAKPRVIILDEVKIDLEEKPDKYEGSWLGFVTRLARTGKGTVNQLLRTEWPFIRFFIEQHIIPAAAQQMELYEYYWGVVPDVLPDGATPTALSESLTGLKIKIDEDIAGPGNINLVPTGALEVDNATFVLQIEEFVKDIHGTYPKLAPIPMEILLAPTHFSRYKNGFRSLYGKDTDQGALNNKMVIDTNVELVPWTAMTDDPSNPGTPSDRLIMTYPDNRVNMVHFGDNGKKFDVDKSGSNPRTVRMYSDWWEAIDLRKYQHAFVNN